MKKHFYILFLTTLAVLASCNNQPAYKNTSLSPEERAEALLKELTLEEKVSLMIDVSAPIERLGIQTYNWWNEALHGIARSGLATVFPMPIGMAAAFDPDGLHDVFVAVSDEARAKNAKAVQEESFKRYQGLTVWTPNINIFRDPRWGRGIETYGEDPYLTAVLGTEVVKGLQCLDENEKYDKLHACAKHFAVHSGPEWNRHEFNAENIKPRDLYETYLPAFEALVKEGKVKEVMCAYNRFEGDPCCGSDQLLINILRNEWNYEGIVVSDCGAISDFYRDKAHKTHPDAASASAAAVLSGTDLECGSSYEALIEGVKKGLIKESDIDVSVKRLLKARFELGEMDPLSEVKWAQIPYSVVASAKHDAMALDMARKTM
ncbi:MAG: glycoside hydrolase family 3 protein, partial [Bacteroidaceae bacterium]|nr:glycoside hydrolase family 3 protein [Bacteroidaceae bacterium]